MKSMASKSLAALVGKRSSRRSSLAQRPDGRLPEHSSLGGPSASKGDQRPGRPQVLLVSPTPPPYGGIARWTRTMLDMDPQTLGADLSLIDSSHRQQRSDDTSLASRVITGAVQTLRVVASLLQHLARTGRPSCVHINTSGSLGLVRDIVLLSLCRVLRVRSALHLRFGRAPELLQSARPTIESQLLVTALRLASITISIDSQTFAAVTEKIGSERSVLIPNFIHLKHYDALFERRSRTVLFLGSVTHSKGVDELLTAWKSLSLEGWTLRLIGPISPKMAGAIAALESDDSVEILGPAEHGVAMRYMYEAAFMVLPSYTEGFPNVLLEGMATGTPIIASRVGAIPEMIGGGAGILVPPKDVESLKVAITQFVNDAGLRSRMAEQAYKRVALEYSTEPVMAQYRHVWAR